MRILLQLAVILAAIGAPPAFAADADGLALSQACTSCHGLEGKGDGAIPALAGQPRDKLVSLMTAFRDQPGDATIMNRLMRGYTDAEIAALADYFSNVSSK